ncbi:hypothetical protein [Streptomyces sp. NBC_00094]|uniref:hypothetical protein n=1 Tax=Streptomyces sp. NBC_00094 TaxID=2903620 RepID=UPI002256D67E|nr:hypothetical protein [Streptomyces sp. NBC_00094]MCX5393248.1 hypothetical protein [Streptomyces sp. NBC_00094]
MERTAWQHSATRRSFRRYWRFAWVWLGCGIAGTVGCPWIGIAADGAGVKWLGSLMAGLWALFIGASIFGSCLVFNAARMRHRLRRHPWRPYPVSVLPPGWGGPIVQLRPAGSGVVFVQSVVALNYRWHHVADVATLWFCGVPGQGGVLARPGGKPLLWGRRIRVSWIRRWRERAVGER